MSFSNIHVGTFINDLRDLLVDELGDDELTRPVSAAFDRAVIPVLVKHLTAAGPVGAAIAQEAPGVLHGALANIGRAIRKTGDAAKGNAKPAGKGKLKPGSAAAAERGAKAAETRRLNKLAKEADAAKAKQGSGDGKELGAPASSTPPTQTSSPSPVTGTTRIGGGPQPVVSAMDKGPAGPGGDAA